MRIRKKLFFVIGLFIFFALLAPPAFSESEKDKPREFQLLRKPKDASQLMVLEVEKDRELKREGNVLHVEASDDYSTKRFDAIDAGLKRLEEQVKNLDARVIRIEKFLSGRKEEK